jgi:hypothetical protein
MKRKATLHWCSMRFSRFPHLKNHWQTKKASMVASALQTSNTRCGQCHYGYRQRTGVEKCALSVHTSAAYVLAPFDLSRLQRIYLPEHLELFIDICSWRRTSAPIVSRVTYGEVKSVASSAHFIRAK